MADTYEVNYGLLCTCGKRLGLHRWGTNQCPDPQWVPGRGRREWMERNTFFAARGGDEAVFTALARAVINERADMRGFTDAELRLGERSWS